MGDLMAMRKRAIEYPCGYDGDPFAMRAAEYLSTDDGEYVRALHDALPALIEALEFYANPETYKDRTTGHNQYGAWVRWGPPAIFEMDHYGERARSVLAAVQP